MEVKHARAPSAVTTVMPASIDSPPSPRPDQAGGPSRWRAAGPGPWTPRPRPAGHASSPAAVQQHVPVLQPLQPSLRQRPDQNRTRRRRLIHRHPRLPAATPALDHRHGLPPLSHRAGAPQQPRPPRAVTVVVVRVDFGLSRVPDNVATHASGVPRLEYRKRTSLRDRPLPPPSPHRIPPRYQALKKRARPDSNREPQAS
jgi:hypothetical protein